MRRPGQGLTRKVTVNRIQQSEKTSETTASIYYVCFFICYTITERYTMKNVLFCINTTLVLDAD